MCRRGDVELGRAGLQRHDLRHHRNRRAGRLQALEVERHGAQRAGRDVHEMAARHVVRLAAAPHQDLLCAGPQVEDGHLRGIDAARRRGDRKQNGLAARQELRPEVIAFPTLAVWFREDRRLAAGRRHALEACCRRAVAKMMLSSSPQVAPRLAPSRPQRGRAGPPLMATFLSVTGPGSTKPIHCPSGDENGARGVPERRERRRLELIQCAHEELRASAVGCDPFIDDVRAVRRDREVATLGVHGQRRRTGRERAKRVTCAALGRVASQTAVPTDGTTHDQGGSRHHEAAPQRQSRQDAHRLHAQRAEQDSPPRPSRTARWRCRPPAAADPSRDSAESTYGWVAERPPAMRSSPARSSARSRACQRGLRPRTDAVPSASRRARRQTPTRRSACPPRGPSPARGSCTPRCRESPRRRHRRRGQGRRLRDARYRRRSLRRPRPSRARSPAPSRCRLRGP